MASLIDQLWAEPQKRPSTQPLQPLTDEQKISQHYYGPSKLVRVRALEAWLAGLPLSTNVEDRRGEKPDPQLAEDAKRRELIDAATRALHDEYERARGMRKRWPADCISASHALTS